MNTATHTPTPWKVALRKDNRVPNRIVTETPVYPGAVNPAEIARVIDRADCAFIVKACNAHDELVAALQELVNRCDGDEGVRADGSNIQTMRAHAILEKLEAA